MAGLTHRASNSVSLGVRLSNLHFNILPGDAVAPGPYLETPPELTERGFWSANPTSLFYMLVN